MRKAIIGFLVLFLVSGFMVKPVGAERFKPANIPSTEVSVIETIEKETGKRLYIQTIRTESGIENGIKFIRYTADGEGLLEGAKSPVKWDVIAYFYVDPYLRPHYSKRTIKTPSGNMVREENFNFDYEAKKIYATISENSQTKNYALNFENDTTDKYCIGTATAAYPFDSKRDFKFHYVAPKPEMFTTTYLYKGREKVAVPTGTFDCHKLQMAIDLGALGFVGAFIPPTYMWYTVGPDPQFVKYEGLDGGLGKPYIISRKIK